MNDHTWEIYREDEGLRIRVDAPGERAVSASIGDPFGFCAAVAQEAGLLVEVDSQQGVLTITRPTGNDHE